MMTSNKDVLRDLLHEALETAYTAGMEYVAEMEGVSWTGKSVEELDTVADKAKAALEKALGLL